MMMEKIHERPYYVFRTPADFLNFRTPFLAPTATPKEVVQQLNKAIGQILETPEVKQKLLAGGAEVAGGTSEQFGELLKNETAAWTAVIERSGIKPE
jgi:tripartite-type tricarboxylate transporter receptor subunit TctC